MTMCILALILLVVKESVSTTEGKNYMPVSASRFMQYLNAPVENSTKYAYSV